MIGAGDPSWLSWAIVGEFYWLGLVVAAAGLAGVLCLLGRSTRGRLAERVALSAAFALPIFTALRLGRPALLRWLLPLPNPPGLWPNFHSPALWAGYALVALVILLAAMGLAGALPDLARRRDCAPGRIGWLIFGWLALGWRGEAAQWSARLKARRLLALLLILLAVATGVLTARHLALIGAQPGGAGAVSRQLAVHLLVGGVHGALGWMLLAEVLGRRAVRAGVPPLAASGLALGLVYVIDGPPAGRLAASILMIGAVAAPQLLWLPRLRRAPLLRAAVALIVAGGVAFDRVALTHAMRGTTWTGTDLVVVLASLLLFGLLLALSGWPLPARDAAPASDPNLSDPSPGGAWWGLAVEVPAEQAAHIASGLREAGCAQVRVYSTAPVEGLPPPASTWVGSVAFGMGLLGVAAGTLLPWFAGAVDNPIVIGGEPPYSIRWGLPVLVVLALLLAGVGAFWGMLGAAGLPRLAHPLDRLGCLQALGAGRAIIALPAAGAGFDEQATRALLAEGDRPVLQVGSAP